MRLNKRICARYNRVQKKTCVGQKNKPCKHERCAVKKYIRSRTKKKSVFDKKKGNLQTLKNNA